MCSGAWTLSTRERGGGLGLEDLDVGAFQKPRPLQGLKGGLDPVLQDAVPLRPEILVIYDGDQHGFPVFPQPL